MSLVKSVEPRYGKGQRVHIVRPLNEGSAGGLEHLSGFLGQDMTIMDLIGARIESSDGNLGSYLYYVRSSNKKKVLVPEEWLTQS